MPSGTVHLWKSRNMASKGYIHCTPALYMQGKSSKMKISIYTYWKLAEPRQLKQLQNTAPQALIDGANIWTAMWLYNIVLSENLASWILDHRNSRLDPRISKLEAFELRDARIESRVSSFEYQLYTGIIRTLQHVFSVSILTGQVHCIVLPAESNYHLAYCTYTYWRVTVSTFLWSYANNISWSHCKHCFKLTRSNR